MQTIGPYRLLQALGTSQSGGVWSAASEHGDRVTLAILNADTAGDTGLRNAFAEAANRLDQSGQVPLLASDFNAPTPWLATHDGDGSAAAQIFAALGQAYQPLSDGGNPPEPSAPTSGAQPPPGPFPPGAALQQPTQSIPALQQVSHGVYQVGAGDAAGPALPSTPAQGTPSSSVPNSGIPTAPYSGVPYSGVPAAPYSGVPYSGIPASYQSGSPGQDATIQPPAADRERRRMQLIVAAVVAAVVVLGGGGAITAFALLSGDEGEATITEPTASPTETPQLPIAVEPGVEPPRDGDWPSDWPSFSTDDLVTPVTLAGLGFGFHLPQGWECTETANEEHLIQATCGPSGSDEEVGGDLIVRTCPDPCDADRRVELRRAEEAWGLRWIRDGGYWCWAESEELDGTSRYGLIFVGYWRTTDEGRIDRQVVFRMSGPEDEMNDIRRVANSVRDAIR